MGPKAPHSGAAGAVNGAAGAGAWGAAELPTLGAGSGGAAIAPPVIFFLKIGV